MVGALCCRHYDEDNVMRDYDGGIMEERYGRGITMKQSMMETRRCKYYDVGITMEGFRWRPYDEDIVMEAL